MVTYDGLLIRPAKSGICKTHSTGVALEQYRNEVGGEGTMLSLRLNVPFDHYHAILAAG